MSSTSAQTRPHSRRAFLSQLVALVALIFLGILAKAIPYLIPRLGWEVDPTSFESYMWNFSPLLPLAVVAGATLSSRWALLLPTIAWFVGDLGVGLVSGHMEWAFYSGMPFVYLCMWLSILIGYWGSTLPQQKSYSAQALMNTMSGLMAATAFFLLSNFFVWVSGNEVMYPRTLGGLLECYTMSLPFYRNQLVSMLVFVPMLTSLMPVALLHRQADRRSASTPVTAKLG